MAASMDLGFCAARQNHKSKGQKDRLTVFFCLSRKEKFCKQGFLSEPRFFAIANSIRQELSSGKEVVRV